MIKIKSIKRIYDSSQSIYSFRDTQCKFISSGGFSNNITALLTFKTSQDGFRLFIQTPVILTFLNLFRNQISKLIEFFTGICW